MQGGLGGPIVRDRAHRFVATEVQRMEEPAPGPYVGQRVRSPYPVPVVEADVTRFAEALRGYGLASGRHAARVERGLGDGAAAGVRGTPGFVIGRTTAGDVVEDTAVRGAQPLETFRRIIEQLLAAP